MTRFLRGIRITAQGALILFAVAVLGYNLYVSAARASGQALPKALGFSSAVIISGSMSGAIEVDDVVIARERPGYAVGDVILFLDSEGTIVCHRIVGQTGGGFITKGDANNVEDEQGVAPGCVLGKVIWKLPRLGVIQRYVRSELGLMAVTLAAAALVLAPYLKRQRQERKEREKASSP
jgi:signal peptidase